MPVPIVPNVVIVVEPVQVDNLVFSTLPSPTSVAVTVSHAGATAVPDVVATDFRNLRVVVVLPLNLDNVVLAEAYRISPVV